MVAPVSRRAIEVTNGSSDTSSFIVRYLSTALDWVDRRCLLQLLRRKKFPSKDSWTELYALSHFGIAVVAYVTSFCLYLFGALFALYSAWRIIEVVTFYLKQIIQHEPEVAFRQRSFVLAVLNYFEVTFWFAVWYSVFVKWGSLTIKDSLPAGWAILRESLA